jgi:pimeloyl-ACP methyl ester carboxylesterase
MIAQTSHTLRANGIRQNYIDAGDGPPVVLLHGFPETNFAWRFQIPFLASSIA